MTNIAIQRQRSIVRYDDIKVSEPVAAALQWTEAANGANWMRAKGACLVPLFNPDSQIPKSTTAEQTFRFRVKTRSSALQRVWTVHVVVEPGLGDPGTAHVNVRAPAGSGTYIRGSASAVGPDYFGSMPSEIRFVETLSSQSDSEQEISIGIQVLTNITGVANNTVSRIVGIECYELDRPTLKDNSTDLANISATVRAGEPIFNLDYVSARGVMQTILGADARRVGIYHWSARSSLTRLSATPANLLSLAVPIQGPKIGRNNTVVEVKWSAYAAMAAGTGTGTVAISTTGSGVSDSVTFSSTTPGWSTARTVEIACDDFSEIDGYEADALQISIAGSGTRDIQFSAFSMWVDSVA